MFTVAYCTLGIPLAMIMFQVKTVIMRMRIWMIACCNYGIPLAKIVQSWDLLFLWSFTKFYFYRALERGWTKGAACLLGELISMRKHDENKLGHERRTRMWLGCRQQEATEADLILSRFKAPPLILYKFSKNHKKKFSDISTFSFPVCSSASWQFCVALASTAAKNQVQG